MKVTVLGCGPSQGVPVVGNRWGDCDPSNPKNRRTRPSIVVEDNGIRLLVDMAPDVRDQLLSNEIDRIDAVLFTHLHYDHVAGIGELRTLSHLVQRRLDVFGIAEVLDGLVERSAYLFRAEASDDVQLYKPSADPVPIAYGTPFDVLGIEVLPFMQDHGICESTGFRFGKFAYSTDVALLDGTASDPRASGTHARMDRTRRPEAGGVHAYEFSDRLREYPGDVSGRRRAGL